jgi:hypothetical protein
VGSGGEAEPSDGVFEELFAFGVDGAVFADLLWRHLSGQSDQTSTPLPHRTIGYANFQNEPLCGCQPLINLPCEVLELDMSGFPCGHWEPIGRE